MKKNLLIFIFVFYAPNLFSHHIIGADMYYECMGVGNTSDERIYKIYFEIYSVCDSISIADSIGLSHLEGDQYIEHIILHIDTLIDLEIPNFPCLDLPSNICIQKRKFSIEKRLIVIDKNYTFTFEACCRTFDIDNLVNSGETGSLFFIEISPDAQLTCNSSPIFQDIPPVISCVKEPILYSQHAIDGDGDQLIYEFCTPFNFNSIVLPPPYTPVQFNLPFYSFNQPLGPSILYLDPLTGDLSGVPPTIGRFVVGICVSEYRNGVLMSTTRRDIQLNISPCSPLVEASIIANEITPDHQFVLNSCGSSDIQLENISTDENHINDFQWIIDFGNRVDTILEWNPLLSFPDNGGTYEGRLLLNPDGICSGEAEIIFNITSEIKADFEVDYDTCVAGPIQLVDNSNSRGSNLTKWEWNYGDNMQSFLMNPLHRYEAPGTYEIALHIEDEFTCKDSLSKTINWEPAPPVIIVAPDFAEGCSPLDVTFDNLSWPIDSTYQIEWHFGDDRGSSQKLSPSYSFIDEGVYPIFVSIVSPIGCYIDTLFSDLINVEAPPNAQFDFSPSFISSFNPEIILEDQSQRATNWKWKFDEKDSMYIQSPSYLFSDTGFHEVKLIVSDQYGCEDSISKIIDVVPEITYFLPNAFTPNNDGKNDLFKGKGIIDGMTDFTMSINNRWGEVIFNTTHLDQGWEGIHQKNGEPMPNGVYLYYVSFKDPRGKIHQMNGVVALLR